MDPRDLYRLHNALTASLVIVERLMAERPSDDPEGADGKGGNIVSGKSDPGASPPISTWKAGPDDDEVVPQKDMDEKRAGVFFQDKIDLTKMADWKYRGRRNVLMDMGNGRRLIVWAKGAAISDDEAQRQGVQAYSVECDFCDGRGTILGHDGNTSLCGKCDGKRRIVHPAPWAESMTIGESIK